MIIRVTEVQKLFNSQGVQLSPEARQMIDYYINREVASMVQRCHANNIKRLTPELMRYVVNINSYLPDSAYDR